MNDMDLEFHAVAKTSELDEDQALQVRVGRKEIALYNLAGEIYATDDTCTHAYASMADGYVEGDQIECPLHGACFEIKTGKALGPPANGDLACHPVKIKGDSILVGLPPGTGE